MVNITLHGTSVFLKSLAYVSEHFPLYCKKIRNVIIRFKEQIGTKEKSVYKHLMACDARSDVSEKDLDIVCSTLRGEVHLLTLEALWIRDMKP